MRSLSLNIAIFEDGQMICRPHFIVEAMVRSERLVWLHFLRAYSRRSGRGRRLAHLRPAAQFSRFAPLVAPSATPVSAPPVTPLLFHSPDSGSAFHDG